jgi:hypothetical protein
MTGVLASGDHAEAERNDIREDGDHAPPAGRRPKE